MRAINLLPRDDYRRRRQKHQQAQWVIVVPVIGAVLLSALLSVLFLSASGKVKDRQGQLSALQAELARGCTEIVEWPTSHSPFLSRPDLVADLLVARARA